MQPGAAGAAGAAAAEVEGLRLTMFPADRPLTGETLLFHLPFSLVMNGNDGRTEHIWGASIYDVQTEGGGVFKKYTKFADKL